jgi:hypothetical protein
MMKNNELNKRFLTSTKNKFEEELLQELKKIPTSNDPFSDENV